MSHHTHEHSDADGEGEGFLDKVKDFFTGGDDDRRAGDHADEPEGHRADEPESGERVEDLDGDERVDRGESLVSPDEVSETPPEPREPQPSDRVGEQPIDAAADPDAPPATDRPMNYSGADGSGSSTSGWDGSDEPPGADEYKSRHGNGVDDSGVLADAPDSATGAADSDDGPRTPEAATQSEDAEVRDDVSADALEQDVESDADREQREAEEAREDEERRERGEQFAREHDPESHDVEAGEEFRQRGDWSADEHGGPQVQEPDGTIHDPGTPEADAAQERSEQADAADSSGPEESDPDAVRDGGHGWGSAAPLEGGAMPVGHPVKAWHDTMTFVMPGEDGYEASDPHEWFVDEEAARRAGFRHAHGD